MRLYIVEETRYRQANLSGLLEPAGKRLITLGACGARYEKVGHPQRPMPGRAVGGPRPTVAGGGAACTTGGACTAGGGATCMAGGACTIGGGAGRGGAAAGACGGGARPSVAGGATRGVGAAGRGGRCATAGGGVG